MSKILKTDTDVSNVKFFEEIGDEKRAMEAIEAVAIITSYNNQLILNGVDDE